MAVKILAKVWDGYPGGGSELLAMLALADWSDDEGRCWPSIESISKKMRLSEKQARRVMHSLISAGHVSVTDNLRGGAASRRYQINLEMLLTPPADGRGIYPQPLPPMGGHPSRGWEATPPAHGSRTVIDTSENRQEVAQALPPSPKLKARKAATTLQEFLDSCRASGVSAIPEDDPIHTYAEKVGIDHEMVAVCWNEFKSAYLHDVTKRQADWRAHFRNAVRKNWYKLWYLKDGESAQWTTVGEQARRAAA